ncbi:phosphonoacetaldehyde reductase [Alphaproteobacteria bacterium]|nr:phosphonoacetaldehyde reductase [Alphaproteobacteria bacterium]
MSSPPFFCPTRVVSGSTVAIAFSNAVANRSWILVTSSGWIGRDVLALLGTEAGHPVAIVADAPVNPKVSDVLSLSKGLPAFEVAVAIGGGSVLDAAKGIVAATVLSDPKADLLEHLQNGTPLPNGFLPAPLIAIPTTSGTGSEITRWATIWGDDNVKYSLQDQLLYPEVTILDPALCCSMPREVTLASGLDALSHAMEAVWNNRHTALTDNLARTAIALLKRYLPRALSNGDDIECRTQMQSAAVMAGLAMSTTQTALAHSISYPFTALFGVPHGFACSFTLAEIARFNLTENSERLHPIAEGFGVEPQALPDEIARWLEELGVAEYLLSRVSLEMIDSLSGELITRARAANNIRPANDIDARRLAKTSLQRLINSTQRQ